MITDKIFTEKPITYICFSAFNEECNINPLLMRIAGYFGSSNKYHIVAYDDGSTDNTHATLTAAKVTYPLTIIHSSVNKGLGVGLNCLIEYLCEHANQDSIAIFMDADDTHDPITFDGMFKAMMQEHTVVIASRYCNESNYTGIPIYRNFLSSMASLFWRCIMPLANVKDYTSGFRAFYLKDLQSARLKWGSPMLMRCGFECQVELLFRLREYVSFKEVPITLDYKRKLGKSKMRILQTVWRTISLALYLRFCPSNDSSYKKQTIKDNVSKISHDIIAMNFAVVGAGMLGLTLAYRLSQLGAKVTIFEGANAIGGQAAAWQLGDITWDCHYHVITQQDRYLLDLLDELNLRSEIIWASTKTGFFANKKLYSLSSVYDFLTFPIISWSDKIRLAATILYAFKIKDAIKYHKISAMEWLYRWSGKSTTEKLWQPLLQSKFGDQYSQLSASFIISTIQRMYGARNTDSKQELFGYVNGGYAHILENFSRELKKRGVIIELSSAVKCVNTQDNHVELELSNNQRHAFDRVILTTAAPIIPKICQQLSIEEQKIYNGLSYLGIVCASMLLKTPLSNYYITNIVDRWVPFTGVIEMSALVNRQSFGERCLVYLPKYVSSEDELLNKHDDVLREEYILALEKMYPLFKKEDIEVFKISRVKYVLPMPKSDIINTLLPIQTTVKGVYTIGTGHITDGVFTVNRMIKLAEEALPIIANKI